MSTRISNRIAALYEVMASAAGSDPEIAAMYQRQQQARYKDQRRLAQSLSRTGALRAGLSAAHATDIMWTLANPTPTAPWSAKGGGRPTSTSAALSYTGQVNAMSSDPKYAEGAAYLHGAVVPIGEACIPLLDTGFLRSDLTYDVVHVWRGRFFRLDDHLDRFTRNVARLRLRLPVAGHA